MSPAELSFQSGDLAGCLASLQAEVRQRPSDSTLRTFLAQLLVVLGQWNRAFTQLSVLAEIDPAREAFARACKLAIQCERLRDDVFAGKRVPLVLGDPEPWIALLFESLALSSRGEHVTSATQRAAAWEAAPPSQGTLNGSAIKWIADMDSRIGPILELFLEGKYYWVPIGRVQRLAIGSPKSASDLVWVPVELTWRNGGKALGLMPSRYPGSESASATDIQLARRTEWIEISPGSYSGLGQRMFATDQTELGLYEAHELLLDGP